MKEQTVYVGNTSKKGIYELSFKKGNLIEQYSTNDFARCTYLAQTDKFLYTTIEIDKDEYQEEGYIVAYKKKSHNLINIDKKTSLGKGPCHLEVDKINHMIYISNYTDGILAIYKLNNNGTIGEKIETKVENTKYSHTHCGKVLKKKYIVQVDLGMDMIIIYCIINNRLKEVTRKQFEKNSEPRHICVNKNQIYVVTEKSCELYILELKKEKLNLIGRFSLLPEKENLDAMDTGCAIAISKKAKNIYITLRGKNRICVFRKIAGKLKLIQYISCEGKTPRDICLDKSEKYLLIANQDSNQIAIFKRNKKNGLLTYQIKKEIESPTCIITE